MTNDSQKRPGQQPGRPAPERRTAPRPSGQPSRTKRPAGSAAPRPRAPREFDPNSEYAKSPAYAARQERLRQAKARRRKRVMIVRALIALTALLVIILAGVLIFTITRNGNSKKPNAPAVSSANTDQQTASAPEAKQPEAAPADNEPDQPDETTPAVNEDENADETEAAAVNSDILAEAALLAAGYDYDGAIELLKSSPDFGGNSEYAAAVDDYTAKKTACVPVDPNTVPHIFYHSLVNDPARAFDVNRLGQFAVDGMNAWMTTIEEFDAITQALYDNGYVYVKLRDLVVETKNADGSVSFTPNTQLLLPEGKKAIVLSVDDLSYYHSYEAAGYPEKLVLDENGLVKCKYTDAAGNTTLGDYDVVPRLNTFLRAHPDGAYHGARGLIAMTGYDGVFGYRTDIDYEKREKLMTDQAEWLAKHPDFNRQTEIEEATVIADAIKAEGWEFASHTWGHLSVTQVSADGLMNDNQRWRDNVGNIVGPVDTIIFAHGNDIGDWTDYTMSNDKYAALKGAGYNFYCNVDGSVPYWVQIRSDYVRQGRIDLDGYMLYQSKMGATTVLDNLFSASAVFDNRRPTPVVANGQG